MNKEKVKAYYEAICAAEGYKPLPIKFTNVAKGGACLTYNTKSLTPISISIDLNRVSDVETAIIHELTHQIKLLTEKNPYQGAKDRQKKFINLENQLVEKYLYSKYSEILWK